MKKLVSLAIVLFFAANAFAEEYVASQKITQQVLSGELAQTVYAGDDIEPVKILYENTGLDENSVPEYSSTNFLENFGLSKRWTMGPACEIAGEMRSDIAAGTYKAYILVQDDEGKFAKTEFEFTVLEKEKTLSLKWNESSGDVNQEVTAGESITPIVFDYEGMTSYSVSGLPSGLTKTLDSKKQKIMIVGSVNSDVMSGDYEYKVTVWNEKDDEKSVSGTIAVVGGQARTSIKLFSDNTSQEVLAGNEIEPVVFQFANVRVDESLSSFKFEGSLKGSFAYSVEGNKLTCSGTVDKNSIAGLYTIRVIAIGENNNDTAFANVNVTRESVESSSSSSVAASSSSAEPSSSSSNIEESSSSEQTIGIATVATSGVKFGYANNVLTVAMPNSAMLRVQVFDMMGHLVESFAETEASSKSFNLAHLTKGNYVVRIESARSVRTARILVK
ncbi:T9SS type A sorting domain-containing protein [Fibrobacter sp.]|uniref:T9SS type A sorting domain-containing protein n=1 Tax=Fibrobacter sp. TaxID=35828 RepID=UPI00386E6C97